MDAPGRDVFRLWRVLGSRACRTGAHEDCGGQQTLSGCDEAVNRRLRTTENTVACMSENRDTGIQATARAQVHPLGARPRLVPLSDR